MFAQLGVSQSSVAMCMRTDGLDPAILFGVSSDNSSSSGGGSSGTSLGQGNGLRLDVDVNAVEVDSKYIKYLNLIKVRDNIVKKSRLMREN